MNPKEYSAKISSVKIQRGNIHDIVISLPEAMEFTAGQFVVIPVPGSGNASFSIASSPVNNREIELAVEIKGGPRTTWIGTLKENDSITIKGSYGRFTLQDEKSIVFIAGGVGITPFMSMLRWIRDTRQNINATLFYSCKTKNDVLWLEELEEMDKLSNINIIITLTREHPNDWKHNIGRINPDMITESVQNLDDTMFYACGSTQLIDGIFSMLHSIGIKDTMMKRERW
jgi:ferredoxin-NADP reductase